MALITYADKSALNENPQISDNNKVTADDMNEIKEVTNENYNDFEEFKTNKTLKKLWENPNPNMAFSAQDITLSSDDYDYLTWFCIWYTGISQIRLLSYTILKNYGLYMNGAGDYTPGNNQYYVASFIREVNRNSDTSFNVGNCFVRYGNSTNRPTQNVTLVPVAIYGGKF